MEIVGLMVGFIGAIATVWGLFNKTEKHLQEIRDEVRAWHHDWLRDKGRR